MADYDTGDAAAQDVAQVAAQEANLIQEVDKEIARLEREIAKHESERKTWEDTVSFDSSLFNMKSLANFNVIAQ